MNKVLRESLERDREGLVERVDRMVLLAETRRKELQRAQQWLDAYPQNIRDLQGAISWITQQLGEAEAVE